MPHPSEYFDLQSDSNAALFAGCEQVWQALAGLKDYVKRQLAEGPGVLLPAGNGIPLARHLVAHEGRILEGDFTVESGSIAKGELVVRDAAGRELPGASMVMAGVILFPGLAGPRPVPLARESGYRPVPSYLLRAPARGLPKCRPKSSAQR